MGSVAARVAAVSLVLSSLIVSGACASPRPGARLLVVSPSTPPEIASVLTRMPARDQRQEDELSARLLDLGAPALGTLCSMLGRGGTQDDRAARYALGSLSRYVARPGAESERGVSMLHVRGLDPSDGVAPNGPRGIFGQPQRHRLGDRARGHRLLALR